jgi:hypothetical protein
MNFRTSTASSTVLYDQLCLMEEKDLEISFFSSGKGTGSIVLAFGETVRPR